jgi:hypothetical protein
MFMDKKGKSIAFVLGILRPYIFTRKLINRNKKGDQLILIAFRLNGLIKVKLIKINLSYLFT